MADYHLSVKAHSRSEGKSIVACAAYRSGSVLNDDRYGTIRDYSKKVKTDKIASTILTPPNAPEWTKNREKLWNNVEKAEDKSTRGKTANLAKEIELALPIELNIQQQKTLLVNFCKYFAERGQVVDINIHQKEGNPHAHIMLTTRILKDGEFGKKERSWFNSHDGKDVRIQRERWTTCANEALEKAGFTARIDHRTLKERGIDRLPQVHRGVQISAILNKGMESYRMAIANEKRTQKLTKIYDENLTKTENKIAFLKYEKAREEREEQENPVQKAVKDMQKIVADYKDSSPEDRQKIGAFVIGKFNAYNAMNAEKRQLVDHEYVEAIFKGVESIRSINRSEERDREQGKDKGYERD